MNNERNFDKFCNEMKIPGQMMKSRDRTKMIKLDEKILKYWETGRFNQK